MTRYIRKGGYSVSKRGGGRSCTSASKITHKVLQVY